MRLPEIRKDSGPYAVLTAMTELAWSDIQSGGTGYPGSSKENPLANVESAVAFLFPLFDDPNDFREAARNHGISDERLTWAAGVDTTGRLDRFRARYAPKRG